jgi:hypothetical protein
LNNDSEHNLEENDIDYVDLILSMLKDGIVTEEELNDFINDRTSSL